MPSDCQCSNACACGTKIVTKIISNQKATERLEKLEKEIAKLKEENNELKNKVNKSELNKEALIKKLKKQLDNL